MRDKNMLARHIQPAARKLKLDFVNWQCLRTSYATWLRVKKADPTLEIYQQNIPESQRMVVDGLVNRRFHSNSPSIFIPIKWWFSGPR